MKKLYISIVLLLLLVNSLTSFAKTKTVSVDSNGTAGKVNSPTVSAWSTPNTIAPVVSNSAIRLVARLIKLIKEKYTFTQIQEFTKKVEAIVANTPENKKATLQYLLDELKKLLISLDTSSNAILVSINWVKSVDNAIYESLIMKYCPDSAITPVKINDVTAMTNQQIKEYADSLFSTKDIERLGLLQARLTHSLKPSKEMYYKDRWMTTDEYLYPWNLQRKLSDEALNKLSEMLFDISENKISNDLLQWTVLNHNIWTAIFVLTNRLYEYLSDDQIEEMLICSIEKYYEPLGMYLSAQYYDTEWDAKSAYYYVNLAREVEKINPKNLSNKYKVGTIGEEFSALYSKYIYYDKQGITTDQSRTIKKEIEATIMKKYPQLVEIYYGGPLYNK